MVSPTPIFGLLLALHVHAPTPAGIRAPIAMQLEAAEERPESGFSADEREALAARSDIAGVHRIFGIATFVSMVATVWLGDLQYYDRYGIFAAYDDTPCARGDAVLDFCGGETPWPHAIAATVTMALYVTTAALYLAMPDLPSGVDEGESERAKKLRSHRTLRWIHGAGIVLQLLLGPFLANPEVFGLDRRGDHRLLQGLATGHFVIGLVTVTALGWAGWLML